MTEKINRTFTIRIPDKPGAFMLVTRIIKKHDGNITRVSYNKALDLNTLFVEVRAERGELDSVADELSAIGFLEDTITDARVVVVSIKIRDEPGGLYPVLKILDRYDVNISYISSNADNSDYQDFKMGLLIENPEMIRMILEDISELYPIDIIDYNGKESDLDNTVFYIRLGNRIQRLFDLEPQRTMEFIQESNRIYQMLQDGGEDPKTVFGSVERLAEYVARYRGDAFIPDVSSVDLGNGTLLHTVEPPCGSNTYILEHEKDLLFIDSGFSVYAEEMLALLNGMFPGFQSRKKSMTVTHADVDHCGLLSVIQDADIFMNAKSADGLERQSRMVDDHREESMTCAGYSHLSRIVTNYVPPDPSRIRVIADGPEEHDDLAHIGGFSFGGMDFEIYEGAGGHLYGEMVFVCRDPKIIFTGDVYVNLKGMSDERKGFTSIAPYLMKSVDVDPAKAKRMRESVKRMIEEMGEGTMVLTGHGPAEIR